jgi:hypothetical protein
MRQVIFSEISWMDDLLSRFVRGTESWDGHVMVSIES